MSNKTIIALDTSQEKKVTELVEKLDNRIINYKIGLEQYLASRGKVIDFLRKKNKNIFLDLKFHDIPNTISAAAREAVKEGIWMFNIHVTGLEGMKRVTEVVYDEAAKNGIKKPLTIGVTVLTSLSKEDLSDLGITLSPNELAVKRALLAKNAGLDGVVTSPKEVKEIRENCGSDFMTVCPGIRPQWAVKGDQKRVMTPKKALGEGASYLVIGRPVTQADDPAEAADKIISEIEEE